MNADIIAIASAFIAIVAVIAVFATRHSEVTPATINAAMQTLPSVAAEVEKAATIVVNAYEQARRKGKVESTPEISEVMNRVRGWLPDPIKNKVSNEQIIDAINSAILLASAASAQIATSKAAAASATVLPAPSIARMTPPPPPPLPPAGRVP